MKYVLLVIICVINTLLSKTSADTIDTEWLSAQFWNLPVDSSDSLINSLIRKDNSFTLKSSYDRGEINCYVFNKELYSEIDSISLKVRYERIPIGAIHGMLNSPVACTHFLTKSIYFNDSMKAIEYYKELESQLRTVPSRFDFFL